MICINLYGGPGCGKSTLAAFIFHKLKSKGLNVELIQEFAKVLTYEKSNSLSDQLYVLSSQHNSIYLAKRAKVDIVVLDSPLLLSSVYSEFYNYEYDKVISIVSDFLYKQYSNIDIFVESNYSDYFPIGRNENIEDAILINSKIKKMLDYDFIHNRYNNLDIFIENLVKKIHDF